jgi:cadmium resistance transport/sequestration family protein
MPNLIRAITTGTAAFAATNLDYILILTLLFSQVDGVLRRRHIVIGQYLGFGLLIVMSLSGFLAGMLLPPAWIGLLGLAPIFFGLRRLKLLNSDSQSDEIEREPHTSEPRSFLSNYLSPQASGVAAMTFANGGDNIGIYVPLFAACSWEKLLIILAVFFTLVGVWCYTAYRLANLPVLGKKLTHYGSYLVPFVLMALGVSIMLENETLEDPVLLTISMVVALVGLVVSWPRASESEVS